MPFWWPVLCEVALPSPGSGMDAPGPSPCQLLPHPEWEGAGGCGSSIAARGAGEMRAKSDSA